MVLVWVVLLVCGGLGGFFDLACCFGWFGVVELGVLCPRWGWYNIGLWWGGCFGLF